MAQVEICTEVDVDLEDFEIKDIIEYLTDEGYDVVEGSQQVSYTPRFVAKIINNSSAGFLRDVISELVWCPSNTDVDFMLSKLKEML